MIEPNILPKICFGCEPLGGTDWGHVNIKDIEYALAAAVEKGINFFDTADVYGLGMSEQRLSLSLGHRRHDAIIATKVGVRWQSHNNNGSRALTYKDGSPNYLKDAVHACLKRLQLDCLPICYLHWPDPITPISQSIGALLELKQQGKIQYVGCSNINLSQLMEIHSNAQVDILQLQYNVLERHIEDDILAYCSQHHITVVVYGVLAQGLLTAKYIHSSDFPENDRRSRLQSFQNPQITTCITQFKELAVQHHMSCAQLAICWAFAQAGISSVIIGIKNQRQLDENIAALNFEHSDNVRQAINRLFSTVNRHLFSSVHDKK